MNDAGSPADEEASNNQITILVAEDDRGVRHAVARTLMRLGYKVLTAESGLRALSLAAQYYGVIDVLLTDVILPDFEGPQVAAEMRRSRPGIKVLYMSGHDTVYLAEQRIFLDSDFIAKPFLIETLKERLETLLARGDPT